MNKQEFTKTIRSGDHKFHLDNVVITTNDQKLTGKGSLEVKANKFKVFVTLPSDSKPPPMTAGIKMRKDFWAIQGLIENEIGFIAHSLPFSRVDHYASGQPSTTLQFSTDRLELLPEGFECMTSKEVQAMHQEVSRQAGVVQTASESPRLEDAAESAIVQARFRAILPGVKLIERNGGTETKTSNSFLGDSMSYSTDTFQCEMENWKCGLVEREGDLHAHLISKPGFQSLGQDHEQKVFHALPLDDKWKDLFEVWRDARNPLSHRMSGGGDSDQSIKDEIVAESKIAGAINCMVLKLMGYSGYVRASTVGDEYIQI